MIRNVIFDIGNVLVDFDWAKFVRRMAVDEREVVIIENAMWHSGLWNERDRGVQRDEDIFKKMLALAPQHQDLLMEVDRHIGECVGRREFAIPWIQELREKGYRVLYLSNYSRRMMQANWNALDFIPYMDGGIYSCDVKLLKPDPAIYMLMIERFGLKPEECLFVDDNELNTKGAEKCGFRTIRFFDYDQAHLQMDLLLEQDRKG